MKRAKQRKRPVRSALWHWVTLPPKRRGDTFVVPKGTLVPLFNRVLGG